MEADTPGRYEVEEEEIEMKEREEQKYLRPIDWYSQREPHNTLTWKEGEKKYKYDFFNRFNPKTVFNHKTAVNKNIRKDSILFLVDGLSKSDINERADYFKGSLGLRLDIKHSGSGKGILITINYKKI